MTALCMMSIAADPAAGSQLPEERNAQFLVLGNKIDQKNKVAVQGSVVHLPSPPLLSVDCVRAGYGMGGSTQLPVSAMLR